MVFKGMKCDVLGWIHLIEDRKEWQTAGMRVVCFEDL
jgi:hypothetical protein